MAGMGGSDMTSSRDLEEAIDVEAALERLPLSGLPLRVVVIMALVLIADGFDIILLGFVAPLVAKEFGLSHAGMGLVLTMSLIGVAAGGFLGGYYGDRMGRRKLIIISLILFGSMTLISALAQGVVLFGLSRLVAGLGLGAATPNAAALMIEMLPARWRSQITTAAYASSTIGTTGAGLLARDMLAEWGWRGLFVAGAVLPLLVCVLVLVMVPESPKFLATLRDGSARTARALNRLMGHAAYRPTSRFRVSSTGRKGRFADLLSPDYRRDTLCMALMIFMILFAWVALGNWGTIVITALGHDLKTAVSIMMGYNLAGLAGAVVTGLLLRRLGSRRIFAMLALCGIAVSGCLALLLTRGAVPLGLLCVGIWIIGAALTALLQASYPVVANAFPTDFRALGLGSTFGFGRLGAVISSMATAALMTQGGPALFFVGVSAASAGIFAALLLVDRHIEPAARSISEDRGGSAIGVPESE